MKKTNFTKIMTLCLMLCGLFGYQNAQAQCATGQTQVTVTMANETFDGENGWILWDATANANVACANTLTNDWNEAVPVEACVTDGNTIELYVYESFGDGWQGGIVTVESSEDGSNNGCNAQALFLAEHDDANPPAGLGFNYPDDNDMTNGTIDGGINCNDPFDTGTNAFPDSGPILPSATFTVNCILCEILIADALTFPSDPGVCGANVTLPLAVASADCPAGSVIVNDYNAGGADASGDYPVGTTIVTYSTAGGTVTATLAVTVLDTEGPALTCPTSETRGLDGGECNSAYFFEVGAEDNCPSTPFSLDGPFCNPCDDPQGGSALACAPFAQNSIIQSISTGGVAGEITQVCYNQETFGQQPLATFNFYINDGSGTVPWDDGAGTFTPLASEMYQTSNADNGTCVCVDLVTPIPVDNTITALWLEVFTPGTTLNSRIVNTPATCNGNNANGTDTYIAAPACGLTPPATFASVGFVLDASYALTIQPGEIEAIPSPTAPSGYNAYESGELLPIGTHCFQYEATDAAGNLSSCDWCVTVEEFPNPISTLSCNSNLNHGVNASDCEFFMTPDLILEGGPYGCYENYIVTIAQAAGGPALPGTAVVGNGTNSVLVKASQLPGFAQNGMAGPYDIQITDPATGVSCWGSGHMFEDKVAPVVTCPDPITIPCTASTEPGDNETGETVAALTGPSEVGVSWGDFTTGDVGTATLNVAAPAGAKVDAVEIEIDLDHSWMGDVSIDLVSPNGVTVNLLTNGGPCGNDDNLSATFTEGGPAAVDGNYTVPAGVHEDCNVPGLYVDGASLSGEIGAAALADLVGADAIGDWSVVFNDGVGGDGGCVQNITLTVNHTVFAVQGPDVFENCGAYTLESTDEVEDFDCSNVDGLAQTITRTHVVTDAKGNSASCVQIINVSRGTLADIVYPANRDNLEEDALDCSDADTDPSNTGEPTGSCDNLGCTYSDSAPIPLCGGNSGSYKILRTWTCIDWCTGEIDTEPQIIKVIDEEAPVLTCGPDMNVSTTTNSCEASVLVSAPSWTDNCDTDIDLVPTVSAGTIFPNAPNWIITDLPIGSHTLTWTATDGCGNSSTCEVNIIVTDDILPVAICETYHEVSLTTNEPTLVPASVFDDGSYDNCGPVTFEVRRMSPTNCIDFDWTTDGPGFDELPNGVLNQRDRGQTFWYPAVPFACCDVGGTHLVEFRVTDVNGNSNTCMVNITVVDKIDPVIECPDDKTYQCSEDINESADIPIDGVSASGPGSPAYYVELNGPGSADNDTTFVGFYADVYDNCEATVYIRDAGDINNCGFTEPWINRFYTAIDGGGRTDVCVQRLTVVNPFDFDENDITWPNDVTVSCPTDPTSTGEPSFNDDNACANVHFTAEPDILIPLNNDTACYKILRPWIVIDWCQYDGQGNGIWNYTQTIKVQDEVAPTIDSGCDNVVVDINTDNDGDFTNGCTGDVELSVTGSDNCASESALEWTWELDAFNDGSVNQSGSGNSNTFNNLPVGVHSITWTLTDGCGNFDQCTYLITVEDNTPPLVYGDYGMEVNLAGGNATLWANDFDEGSSDECSDICDMRIASPSGGPGQTAPPTTTSVSFDCDDLGNNTIDFWVKDCANNWAYVSSFVIIQDNNLDCTNPGFDVAGGMNNELGEGVEGVNVDLTGYMTGTATTADDGLYSFTNLPADQNYTVTPTEDLPVLNGISTWDLVLISKHVLQIEALDSPYKIIAADVNTSGNVSTLDMVELRKLILLIETEFPNNDASWRFVPANFVFPDATDPWVNGSTFPEVASINNLDADMVENFVAIKKGDVNNSHIPNQLIGGEDRTMTGDLVLSVDDRTMEAGQEYTVDFNAKDFSEILGYQFSLAFDTDAVEFVNVEAGNLTKLTEANFGLAMLDEGVITTSWNNQVATNLKDNDVVFSVTFKANANTQLSDVINISSRATAAEAYNDNLELLDVAIEYNQDGEVVTANDFALFQNTPNPFKDATVISFTLPEAQAASLKVYDVSGRILHAVSGDYAKGYNEVVINRSDLNGSGVLYYQLDTDSDSATKKMIIIE